MQKIADKSIDMILCDLPYGTTACKWDTIIPFEPLWEQYKRIIKDNGAIVLTASQPFTSALVMSNIKMFKYEWIWEKERPSNICLVKSQPGRCHENIIVFGNGKINYFPQMEPSVTGNAKQRTGSNKMQTLGGQIAKYAKDWDGTKRYPRTVRKVTREYGLHPTQKPVALFEYLIRTYTNEGDLVLDNCAGSGTTGVACQNLKRDFILIEKEPEYVEIIKQRLTSTTTK
jgi:site-specific DNA-methyltransferase (adenine-specific)